MYIFINEESSLYKYNPFRKPHLEIRSIIKYGDWTAKEHIQFIEFPISEVKFRQN